jgi:hypothetical protein
MAGAAVVPLVLVFCHSTYPPPSSSAASFLVRRIVGPNPLTVLVQTNREVGP